MPWAATRTPLEATTGASSSNAGNKGKKLTKEDLDESYKEYLKIEGMGAIV